MSKKRLKFKKRHKFSLSELMPKERRIRDNLKFGIPADVPRLGEKAEIYEWSFGWT